MKEMPVFQMAKTNVSFVSLVKVSSVRISAMSKGMGTRSTSDIRPLPATPTAHLFSAAVAVATSCEGQPDGPSPLCAIYPVRAPPPSFLGCSGHVSHMIKDTQRSGKGPEVTHPGGNP